MGRAVRAAATLFIGLLFFTSAAWMNRSETEVRFTLRWLLVGLGLNLAWSGMQAVTFYTPFLPKQMVTHWQLAFSMRELVRTNRISGLAYEPSWLAGQLATVYLPVLFASVMSGVRLTSRRWLEPVLLVVCAALILATYSRGGLLIAAAAAALTFLLLGRDLLRRALEMVLRRIPRRLAGTPVHDRRGPAGVRRRLPVPGPEKLFPPPVGSLRGQPHRLSGEHQCWRALRLCRRGSGRL